MKNYILYLTLSLIAINSKAQDGISEAKWQAKPITLDGNDNEWSHPFNFYDNQSALIFSISNDSKNLYVCFSNNDRMKTGKMMKAGWSLELFSSEKKRKFDASIVFPKSIDPGINMKSDFNAAVKIYKSEIQTIKTKGFLTSNGDVSLSNEQGINIAVGADEEEKIVYEFKIPLKELMEEDKIQLNEIITLELTVNALEKPSSSGSGEGTKSGFSGGGGGRGGGGHGGGHGGSGMGGGGRGGGGYNKENAGGGDRSSLYEKVSFKQKVKLVKQ
ncbi:MAG: hypothetical protein WCH78_00295 [Bacteroidota bacterium]